MLRFNALAATSLAIALFSVACGGSEDSSAISVSSDAASVAPNAKPPPSACKGSTTSCGGVCVNLKNNVSNCGACGNACSIPNATAACVRSTCGFVSCNPGWGDCDGTLADGCETDFLTSANHCGACGNACTAANGTASCTGGTCGVTSCDPGYYLSNGACVLIGPPSAVTSTLAATPTSQTVAGTIGLTATIKDAYGNPISGTSVTFASSGAATLYQPAGPTDAAGVATGSVSSAALGQQVITARVGAISIATTTVTFTAEPIAVSPTSTTVAAGGQVTFVASGGFAPYAWSISPNNSGGTITSVGLYTAGATGGVSDTIVLTDSQDATANATADVSSSLACPEGWADCYGTGACEVNLTTDSAHCGRCDHSCQGGACASSTCGPVLIASGEFVATQTAASTAFDPSDGFFTLARSAASEGLWQVARVSKAGEITPLTQVTGGLSSAYNVVSNSTHVYWTGIDEATGLNETLMAIPRTGGVPKVLAPPRIPFRPYADDAFIYFSQWCDPPGDYLARIPVEGTIQTLLECVSPSVPVNGRIPESMVVADGTIYYVMDNGENSWDGLYYFNIDGSGSGRLVRDFVYGYNGNYRETLVDGGVLYFGGAGFPAGGWLPAPLITYDTATGEVVPLGAQDVSCDAGDYCETFGIAFDAERIYFIVGPYYGRLYSYEKATGSVAMLVEMQYMHEVFVDDMAIFFTSHSGIWRLAKP